MIEKIKALMAKLDGKKVIEQKVGPEGTEEKDNTQENNGDDIVELQEQEREEIAKEIEENYSDIIQKKLEDVGKRGKYQSEVKNLQRFLMYSLAMNLGFFILFLFFSFSFASVLNNRDVTILVPPGTHQDLAMVFGPTHVNEDVVRVYSDFLARSFGNIDYETVSKNYDTLVRYSDGSVRHRFKMLLDDLKHTVIENYVTQEFTLQRIEILRDREGLLAKCYGFATRKVGGSVQFEKLPYLLQFSYKAYGANLSIVGMSSSINRNPDSGAAKNQVDQYEKDNQYVNF